MPSLNLFLFLKPGSFSDRPSCFLRAAPSIGLSQWFTTDPRFKALPSILFLTLFWCSACTPNLYWAKAGAAEGDFEQDLRLCRETLIAEVQQSEMSLNPLSRGITDDALAQCLNSRGWFLAEKPSTDL